MKRSGIPWGTGRKKKNQAQKARVKALGKKIPKNYVVKGESLFDRARKFGMSVNSFGLNRASCRKDIKEAIREERRK